MKKYLWLPLALSFLFISCTKNDDGVGLDPNGPNPNNVDATTQDFMWKAMNLWYFWQQDVADLADDRFTGDADYTEFLVNTPDPAQFFDQLKFEEDRFSWAVSDYKELVNSLSGVTKSNGLDFTLFTSSDSESLFGVINYILPNSDASTKDISRGEIFTAVNGTALTLSNYNDLLFGEEDTYTLNMADVDGTSLTPNGKEVTLTKFDNFQEDPIFINKTFDINGHKIGYLVYNRFLNEFDEQLNAAFGQMKTAGITDLVLDLRYNAGGSVNTSRLLSSMIFSTNTNLVFLKDRWNDKLQDILSETDYFAATTNGGSPINTLNFNKVYILTTRGTASASELVINGLNPYIDVFLIGRTTRGKNEFSITMVDDPGREGAPYLYSSSRENFINPNNQWGIQPLLGRTENSEGFLDYTEGFAPMIDQQEELGNYGELGDESEPLLSTAIEEITGISSRKALRTGPRMQMDYITNSKMFDPLKDNMILDRAIDLKIQ
ncbi:MAG: S41 family peptidase [Flavobacteriaceae bacterium]